MYSHIELYGRGQLAYVTDHFGEREKQISDWLK